MSLDFDLSDRSLAGTGRSGRSSAPPRSTRSVVATVALLVLAFIPGIASILLGRIRRGIGLFLLVLVSLNAAVLVTEVFRPPGALLIGRVLLGLAGFAVLASIIDTVIGLRHDPAARDARARALLQEGFASYLSGDFPAAARTFRSLVQMDRTDAGHWLRLGLATRRLGQHERAARLFRKARRIDREGRWHLEVDRELERAAPGDSAPHRPPAALFG